MAFRRLSVAERAQFDQEQAELEAEENRIISMLTPVPAPVMDWDDRVRLNEFLHLIA